MNPLLLEGLVDAIGFVAGALVGYGLGRAFGVNVFDAGYTNGSIAAILLVGLGGGIGLQAARRWRASRKRKTDA